MLWYIVFILTLARIKQTIPDENGIDRSGLDLYFLDRNGGNFKASLFHQPYLFVDVADSRRLAEISQHLQKRFDGCVVELVEKEDLQMANHLSGKRHKFLKLSFNTVADLMDAKMCMWYDCRSLASFLLSSTLP